MFIHDRYMLARSLLLRFQNRHSVQSPDENFCFIHDQTTSQDNVLTLSMYLNVFSLMLYK